VQVRQPSPLLPLLSEPSTSPLAPLNPVVHQPVQVQHLADQAMVADHLKMSLAKILKLPKLADSPSAVVPMAAADCLCQI
jgi:hypothetical protein